MPSYFIDTRSKINLLLHSTSIFLNSKPQNMKISLLHLNIVLIVLLLASCGKKSETTSAEELSNEWPELDSFHSVMSDAFHPYKDSANVAPVKRLADEMALEAERWQRSTLPEKVNNDVVKDQLEKLKVGARKLADQIKAGASDAEIGASLTTLHDNFHTIMEGWYGGGGEKNEH